MGSITSPLSHSVLFYESSQLPKSHLHEYKYNPFRATCRFFFLLEWVEMFLSEKLNVPIFCYSHASKITELSLKLAKIHFEHWISEIIFRFMKMFQIFLMRHFAFSFCFYPSYQPALLSFAYSWVSFIVRKNLQQSIFHPLLSKSINTSLELEILSILRSSSRLGWKKKAKWWEDLKNKHIHVFRTTRKVSNLTWTMTYPGKQNEILLAQHNL